MQFLVIILNREDYLETILSILIELNTFGTSIVHSEGLGHFLAYEVPIFAELKQLVSAKNGNHTILVLLQSAAEFKKFKILAGEEGIDFTKKGVGIAFTVPVNSNIQP